jgi:type IV pilus assembly PilX-like protein
MGARGKATTMTAHATRDDRRQEGSALIIAALVTVILSLLGLSYTMMAQTENTIAENERNSTEALYAAEAGARLVVGWFNDPTSTGYLVPATGSVDRTKRVFDHDLNPATARVLAVASNSTKPLYKDGSFTTSGIFDRPFRSALADTFMGVETGTDPDPSFADKGPDVIVNQSHLDTINNALFPNFPTPNLRARITRIEVYGPPMLTIGGNLTRMGVATVKVTAGIFIFPGTAAERQVATRIAKAVVNEIPVPGPVGPLQSCVSLAYTGSFDIHWGTGSTLTNAFIPNSLNVKVNSGLPYALNDPFTYISGGTTLASWATAHTGQSVEDPWYKFIAGGTIDQATNTNVQPWTWSAATPIDQDHSNMFQNTVINCPTFDYSLWKSIAQSGLKNNYYYKWVSGTNFSLDGTGPSTSFETLTNGKAGILFFDTTDGLAPDVAGSNLTPAVTINGAGWNTAGFMYANTADFRTTGTGTGVNRTVVPPGEPGDGSGFVNFDYPSSLGGGYTIRDGTVNFETFQDPVTGDWYCTDASQCDATTRTPAASPVKDSTGLAFTAGISVYGVFYLGGTFTAQGNANYFGSVVAQRGVIDGAGDPAFYFDERLVKGSWPPKGMNIPRVVVSSWQTDL